MKRFSKIALLVIILAILAGATGYYLIQIQSTKLEIQKEDVGSETVNWKTYRNEKYGFEVKYPEDWKIGDAPKENFTNFVSPEFDEKFNGEMVKQVFQIYLSILKEENNFGHFIGEPIQIVVGGVNAIQEKFSGGGFGCASQECIQTKFMVGSNYFNIYMFSDIHYNDGSAYGSGPIGASKGNNSRIYNTILSTFKFIP
ncbi:MAG: hypothetical protein A3C07_00440 [Candidatus Sungbacteria bacterium RIFCSPHIGHO2_02_FULL_47_11]|uniref:Uncharacterized protein n=1 Tax=Candidatus Sungbacteria bacterium RIFCSPHIGHO2_02_FULL_47_11 TaxID=1802270 RepID=A0A1G2KIL9_9BACT|nr:MAG: hypothetical protein A3C07_00440 [Candidatus Sungbacteria bacterium RIFCSPHIGHO2_02_FULL_47_11]